MQKLFVRDKIILALLTLTIALIIIRSQVVYTQNDFSWDPNAPTAEYVNIKDIGFNLKTLIPPLSKPPKSLSTPPEAGLWIVTNDQVDTIYHVDPLTGAVISSFPLPGSNGYDGAGLEADLYGNLWAVNQANENPANQMVYKIAPDGTVLDSWPKPNNISYAWGIGHDGSEVWISDMGGYLHVGENKDVEVTTEGIPTGVSWPVPWAGYWAADLAWDGRYLWQVNVGGDNNIYRLDPITGEVTAVISDPDHIWNAVSQRALAYDRTTDTFYIGGWNQDKMYRIQGLSWPNPGKIISSFDFHHPAGAAWITSEPAGGTIVPTSTFDLLALWSGILLVVALSVAAIVIKKYKS
ncbi:MAG: hypothetical protein QXV52_03265 [Nitrososphaeria archaeon]